MKHSSWIEETIVSTFILKKIKVDSNSQTHDSLSYLVRIIIIIFFFTHDQYFFVELLLELSEKQLNLNFCNII